MTPNLSNRQKEFGEVSSRKILEAKTNVQDYKEKSDSSDESLEMVAFEHDSTEKPIRPDIDGSENIQERHSDLYSTHNVSRRVPRISTFIEKGATNSKRFETDFSMSV